MSTNYSQTPPSISCSREFWRGIHPIGLFIAILHLVFLPVALPPNDPIDCIFPTTSIENTVTSETSSLTSILPNEPTSSFTPASASINTKKKAIKRCYLCTRKLDRKVATTCYYCEINICVDHSDQYYVCNNCRDEFD
ncbi:hypothetical protein LOD99_9539 [Oopsacas minuta]|uniref:Uncharacterized protein n=1 Tax=Oopsacas minuta TaxID=111878 RepID=A0AAV7JBL0_9METZ|nr:hypothetical protein LOD99_9539 [Oopsacas minuta]